MFVRNANQSNSLKGVFAPYPKETVQGGHNKLQKLVMQEKIILRSVPVDEVFAGHCYCIF